MNPRRGYQKGPLARSVDKLLERRSRLDFDLPAAPDRDALEAGFAALVAAAHPVSAEWVDESVLDGKIVVDSRSSFAMSKELTTREGLFVGVSCGSVVKAALKVAERLQGEHFQEEEVQRALDQIGWLAHGVPSVCGG